LAYANVFLQRRFDGIADAPAELPAHYEDPDAAGLEVPQGDPNRRIPLLDPGLQAAEAIAGEQPLRPILLDDEVERLFALRADAHENAVLAPLVVLHARDQQSGRECAVPVARIAGESDRATPPSQRELDRH